MDSAKHGCRVTTSTTDLALQLIGVCSRFRPVVDGFDWQEVRSVLKIDKTLVGTDNPASATRLWFTFRDVHRD